MNDIELPSFINCPADINVPIDPGQCEAIVNYPSPTATDNCDPNVHPTSLPDMTAMGTINGHTYFLSNYQTDVLNAQAVAQSFGGHLVTITDATENATVSVFSANRFWIGLTDQNVEGTFEWTTGEAVNYTNWDVANGEPNDFNSKEDWTVMNFQASSGLWNDYSKNNNAHFVIEFDPGVFPVTHTAGPVSGSAFPIGTTPITFTTTDPSGNSQNCTFNVTVTDANGACSGPTCVPLEIVSLDLITAGTGGLIDHLADGYIINKAAINGNISVEAIPCSGPVGSVIFSINGNNAQTESVAPYAINGDSPPGNYTPWKPQAGLYTITATPYSNGSGNGSAGIPLTVNIEVIDSGAVIDCNGDTSGTAIINECDSCVGGNTGRPLDFGKDDCGVCRGNNNDKDCHGDCFGSAFTDDCGACAGGNSPIVPNSTCNVDCNGDVNGSAFLDDCGVCVGGATGKTANADKDTCGVCFGNNFSCAPCGPLGISNLVLVDVNSGIDIMNLANGSVIDKSIHKAI
ncbi:MAG: lectin-like protein [Owenweeksia sp.]|nr:lectin-like protein [Owenweeksia sp.]